MNELDPRLLSVDITTNGVTKSYNQNFAIRAMGTHYANSLSDDAEISIFNLDRPTLDFLISETSPYTLNRSLKDIKVYAGRQSYGKTLIYSGNVVSSIVSQPPDIGITFKCLTGAVFQGSIYSVTQPGLSSYQEACLRLSKQLNAVLTFEAEDKILKNYTFNGTAVGEILTLNSVGGVNVFLYGAKNTLVVKGAVVPLRNTLREVNVDTGMIGIPEFTALGIRVKFFIDAKTTLGGALRVTSQRYPAFNGDYVIYKLGFDVASRDTPFYYIAEAARVPAGAPVI